MFLLSIADSDLVNKCAVSVNNIPNQIAFHAKANNVIFKYPAQKVPVFYFGLLSTIHNHLGGMRGIRT